MMKKVKNNEQKKQEYWKGGKKIHCTVKVASNYISIIFANIDYLQYQLQN